MGTKQERHSLLTADRLSELREATDGLGARNRIHPISNDELVELLDLAEGRTRPVLAVSVIDDVITALTSAAMAHDGLLDRLAELRAVFRVALFDPEARSAKLGILREGSPGSERFA